MGCLIAFEGVARSGKSTLINLLNQELSEKGIETSITEWNSYPGIQDIINHKKTHFTFSPLTYSLMHLSDFALRYEERIRPALERESYVIADRWYYTAFTRDVVRGIPLDYVQQAYQFARKPDVVFFIDIPVEIALERHYKTKTYFGYNSGTDIWPELTAEEAFKTYFSALKELYLPFIKEDRFIYLDGTNSPDDLMRQVRAHLSAKDVSVGEFGN
ncbi:dTMP kinase [Paenibacillus medicaginis]|uniref:Thymidylate kinase n=1 Tax=Paenibacillus medicaginis TaxID=1470560 RepID=A0ABV5C1U0_9BACL